MDPRGVHPFCYMACSAERRHPSVRSGRDAFPALKKMDKVLCTAETAFKRDIGDGEFRRTQKLFRQQHGGVGQIPMGCGLIKFPVSHRKIGTAQMKRGGHGFDRPRPRTLIYLGSELIKLRFPYGDLRGLGLGPVSYTHLDVYKRQVLTIAMMAPNSICGFMDGIVM